jgi:hypothetical protein
MLKIAGGRGADSFGSSATSWRQIPADFGDDPRAQVEVPQQPDYLSAEQVNG